MTASRWAFGTTADGERVDEEDRAPGGLVGVRLRAGGSRCPTGEDGVRLGERGGRVLDGDRGAGDAHRADRERADLLLDGAGAVDRLPVQPRDVDGATAEVEVGDVGDGPASRVASSMTADEACVCTPRW